ncbi:hypothetical protein TNCV_259231 [Trichonephila clavipes]|uniref:Uncharacterized protein n=1 Tax=Trichonephila clavipes TaxID=2585209 RepID=A0A8X6V0H1_TRICX|nr:hypothetical protein TNCV_259231 [Trichonephila clavipes]
MISGRGRRPLVLHDDQKTLSSAGLGFTGLTRSCAGLIMDLSRLDGLEVACPPFAHHTDIHTDKAMDFHMTCLLQQLQRIWECSRDSYCAPFHRIIGSRSICSAQHFHGAAIDVDCEEVTECF